MIRTKGFLRNVSFILFSSIGGLLLSLTGLSIGWMLGTLVMAGAFSFWSHTNSTSSDDKYVLPRFWMNAGQFILAIELGQKINLTVIDIFRDHWMSIMTMLLLSIVFSLLSGLVLWKFSHTDLLTSLFGTVPGGLSVIPGIAEEVGGNIGVVSIIQTMRVFLVVLVIPFLVSSFAVHSEKLEVSNNQSAFMFPSLEMDEMIWTALLALGALAGYYIGKRLKFPAPWLVGGMLGAASIQAAGSSFAGHNLTPWWPNILIIAAQVFIAASIGSKFHKKMFTGLGKTMAVALFSTIGLILSLFICAFIVSKLTGITFVTAVLAFAPGGITEMATTAAVLHEDSTFVVVVQVLRIVLVCIAVPPLIKLLHQRRLRNRAHSHAARNI